jgi:glycosyltransferase involved in cell wall biosynthesis
VFRPTPGDFCERYGLQEQTVILGVAYKWTRGKGFDIFATLADALDDSYKVVLVGVTEKQKKRLPPGVICLPRVTNPKELAALYTAADVFVNPTREETLGLTNLEALACGTPVITFDRGGSPECVDETCGAVVPCDDMPALADTIRRVTRDLRFSSEACRAYASRFNAEDAFGEYVKLYGIAYESTARETI